MGTYYTKNDLSIHFLNDRNIAQTLSDDIEFNPVPSLSLLNTVNSDIRETINLSSEQILSVVVSDISDLSIELKGDISDFEDKHDKGLSELCAYVGKTIVSRINDLDVDTISLSGVNGLSVITGLSEIDGKISVDCEKLILPKSTVYIKNPDDPYLSSGAESSLSVITLTDSEYHDLVLQENINASTIYIISSDYINAYGQVISNLIMSENNDEKYYGIAATDTYVNHIKYVAVNESKAYIDENSFNKQTDNVISGNNTFVSLQRFNDVMINDLSVENIYTQFTNLIDTEIVYLSDYIQSLQGDGKTTMGKVYSAVNQIISLAKLDIDFKLTDTLGRCIEVINEIASNPVIDVKGVELTTSSTVRDIVYELDRIITYANLNVSSSLADVITMFDERIDICEVSTTELSEKVNNVYSDLSGEFKSDISKLEEKYDKELSELCAHVDNKLSTLVTDNELSALFNDNFDNVEIHDLALAIRKIISQFS